MGLVFFFLSQMRLSCMDCMDDLPTWKVKNGHIDKGKWLDHLRIGFPVKKQSTPCHWTGKSTVLLALEMRGFEGNPRKQTRRELVISWLDMPGFVPCFFGFVVMFWIEVFRYKSNWMVFLVIKRLEQHMFWYWSLLVGCIFPWKNPWKVRPVFWAITPKSRLLSTGHLLTRTISSTKRIKKCNSEVSSKDRWARKGLENSRLSGYKMVKWIAPTQMTL